MVRVLSVLVVSVALFVAGCTEPPPEPVDEGPFFPRLAEFEGCPWHYPDNSSVDCVSGSSPIEPEDQLPLGWICTDENRPQGWSLHWNPVAGEHGVWYEAPETAAGMSGVFYLRTNGQEHLFQWEDAPASGFLRFPVEFGDNATFRFELHEFGYAMNGTLGDAVPSPVWSLYERQFWVVHTFEADNGTYSFQNMTTRNFRVEGPDRETDDEQSFHEPRPFEVIGQDFTLWVHHERGHVATSQGSADALNIDRFCQTGLGG